MQVIVSGHHISVGDSLKAHIEVSVEAHVKKYFDHAIVANVTLTEERQHYVRTDIMLNEGTGTGIAIRSTAHDNDPYKSFDEAVVKLERQLKKHKNRLKNHQKQNPGKMAFLEATKYVLSPFDSEEHAEGDAPAIIAEKPTSIEKLSVADAVMKMDLMDLPALAFVNSGSGRVNMVYYRKDGNISWVDIS